MDETNQRWFRWLARNGHQLFFVIWGAGIGAFGVVFTGATNLAGDVTRLYLAALTVMLGGALGLISSKAMDAQAEIRTKRRRIYVVLMQIRRMEVALNSHSRLLLHQSSILIEMPEVTPEQIYRKADYDRLKDSQNSAREAIFERGIRFLRSAAQIQDLTVLAPNFDGLLEGDEDLHHATRVLAAFSNPSRWPRVDPWNLSKDEVIRLSAEMRASAVTVSPYESELQDAAAHFRRKLAD